MRGRLVVLLLSIVLGCHWSPVHVVEDLPDGAAEAEADKAVHVSPEMIAAGRACEGEHDAHACTQASEYWEGDNGHAFDPKKSFRYAAIGCAFGDGLACALLGSFYQNGVGTAWSPLPAIKLYERSCNAGTGLGCARLAQMYANGYGVDWDRVKAKTYRNRAHEEWLTACLGGELRWCPDAAASTREGEPTAHELNQRACDHGIPAGCIAVLHDQLTHPAGSQDAALRALDQWCSRGESAACAELAVAYDQPDGPGDARRAAALMKRACALGDRDACVRIGILHEIERGVPKDDATARRYFGRACERGSSRGCLYLAQDSLVLGGAKLEITHIAQRGCEMGNAEACELLARIYIAYHDEALALRWATEACRMGREVGCQHLIARDAELPKTNIEQVQLYHDACKAKMAPACLRLPELVQAKDKVQRGIVMAVANQDTAAFAKLAADEVELRDLRFDDPACETQFSGTVPLVAAQHSAFLRCLAKVALHLEPAPDEISAPSLALKPDVTLHVDVRDGVVQWIWTSSFTQTPAIPPRGVSRSGADPHDAPLTVAPTTVEAYRISGTRLIAPDPETKSLIFKAGSPRLIGSFKVCITAHGTIANVAMLRSTGAIAYDRIIEREIYGWKYRPFMLDGEPTPVCTAVTFVYTQH